MQRTPFMVLVSVLSLAIIIPQSNDKDHQLNNLISKALDHNPEKYCSFKKASIDCCWQPSKSCAIRGLFRRTGCHQGRTTGI